MISPTREECQDFYPVDFVKPLEIESKIGSHLSPPYARVISNVTFNPLEALARRGILKSSETPIPIWNNSLVQEIRRRTKGDSLLDKLPSKEFFVVRGAPVTLHKRYVKSDLPSKSLREIKENTLPLDVFLAALVVSPMAYMKTPTPLSITTDCFAPVICGDTIEIVKVSCITSSGDDRWYVKVIESTSDSNILQGKVLLLCSQSLAT